MEEEVRLTTIDNPFDPFDQFSEWFVYDITHGYNTCNRLASLASTSEQLSDAEIATIKDEAMLELIKTGAIDKQGNIIEYKKVYRNKN